MTGLQALGLVFAYLLGAVPVGLLAGLARGVDVRKVGSGNIGATNVIRGVGVMAGLAVFLGDVLKGVLAVIVCRALGMEGWLLGMAALLAVMGHSFSPYIGFKGGKGVATSFGVFLAISPLAALTSFVIWIVLVLTSRYVSLASIIAAASMPVMLFVFHPDQPELVVVMALLAILIVGRHNENIERLLAGTETASAAGAAAEAPGASAARGCRMEIDAMSEWREPVAVIGAGAWGTTISRMLGERGIPVSLWA